MSTSAVVGDVVGFASAVAGETAAAGGYAAGSGNGFELESSEEEAQRSAVEQADVEAVEYKASPTIDRLHLDSCAFIWLLAYTKAYSAEKGLGSHSLRTFTTQTRDVFISKVRAAHAQKYSCRRSSTRTRLLYGNAGYLA